MLMADRGVVGYELNIDWDNLLDNLPDDLVFELGDLPPAELPNSGCSFSVGEIEHCLLNDEPAEGKQHDLADTFISDVLLKCFSGLESGQTKDSPLSGSGLDRVKESSASPEVVDVVTDDEEKEHEKRQEDLNLADVVQATENCSAGDDDNGDPNAKKRKRQMRNRDAAVRSRERKKMHVRDLEMKSKYCEAECKRLGIILQCCVAENEALRLSLHTSQAFDASRTKQESAVLLLESLLLGSLLGFLGIIYLLILPSQLLSTLEARLLKEVDIPEGRSEAPREAGGKNSRSLFRSFMMGKRCKSSRPRLKLSPFNREVLSLSSSCFLLPTTTTSFLVEIRCFFTCFMCILFYMRTTFFHDSLA